MENTTSFTDGASHSSANPVQRGVDSAGAALHSGIDKVADPARSAVNGMSSAAHETVNKLASTATHTADRFSDQTRRLSEAPGKAIDASRSWVQTQPFEAVGAALAFGFVIGWLTAR